MQVLIWICVGVVIGVIGVFLFAAYHIISAWDGLDYTDEEYDQKLDELEDLFNGKDDR